MTLDDVKSPCRFGWFPAKVLHGKVVISFICRGGSGEAEAGVTFCC